MAAPGSGARYFLATSAQQALEAIKRSRETGTPCLELVGRQGFEPWAADHESVRPPMRRSGGYTGRAGMPCFSAAIIARTQI